MGWERIGMGIEIQVWAVQADLERSEATGIQIC